MGGTVASSERRLRRHRWFHRGVHAIGCVLTPRPPEAYLCPLCLEFFTVEQLETGSVTDEHVPPKAVGGHPLVLTCRSCNSASSGLFDEAMADDEKLRTFGTPNTLAPLPGSVTSRGRRNNGLIRFDGETFVMLGQPGQNNPAVLAAYTESLNAAGPGSSFELRIRIKRNRTRAAIGWMRSAYLAGFAVYGYRYVLQPAFEPLRAAIADPDSEFDPVLLQAPDQGTIDPLIAEVSAPAALAGCRAVVFGPRLILLPQWQAPKEWFAGLRELVCREAPTGLALVSTIGRRFPEGPMHLTDG